MAESGLAMEYADYLTQIARVAGVLPPDSATATASTFDARTLARLHETMDSGLRQFYNAREWTFLSPDATLYTANGVATYDLPDDFDSMLGPFHYTEAAPFRVVERVSWDQLRNLTAQRELTGYPRVYAVSPVAPTSSAGTRWQAELHPTPTQAWTLAYRYRVLQEPLRSTNTRPCGGATYSHAILASMLDILETQWFDASGPYRERWAEALAFAARRDTAGQDRNLGVGATEPEPDGAGRGPRHVDGLVQYQAPS